MCKIKLKHEALYLSRFWGEALPCVSLPCTKPGDAGAVPTLKSTLHAYGIEIGRDWEEGMSWFMLAAIEIVQESTAPNNLVFGHVVL